MITRKGGLMCYTAAMVALVAGSQIALADLPAALDRVPADTKMVVTIRNMERLDQRITALSEALQIPMDVEGNPMMMAKGLLGTPGLNKSGSMSMILVQGGGEAGGEMGEDAMGQGEEPQVVMIVPVSDYSAFVKAMGSKTTEGVSTLEFEGEEGFAKDIGGGFAALSPQRALLDTFNGKTGNLKDQKSLLGKVNQQVADNADVMITMNMNGLREQMKEGVAAMKDQAQMMAGMMAGQAEAAPIDPEKMITAFTGFLEEFADQSQSVVFAMGFGESGVWMDMGAQFKEGTEMAASMAQGGSSGKYIDRLPKQPFLFAMSVDGASPAIRGMIKNMAAMNKDNADPASTYMAMAEDIDGYAFQMGSSPGGIMGGVLANSSAYIATNKAKQYVEATRAATKAMDGKAEGGVTMKVTYTAEGVEIANTKIDSYSIAMVSDPNDPAAAQMQMVQGMIFGPGGLSGMLAPVNNGVVMTMSQNTALMTTALEASKGNSGLASEPAMAAARAALPENRVFEAYIGTKAIMDQVTGFMAMMGGGPNLTVPANLSHVAMAGVVDGGGMQFRFYVPNDVIKTAADFGKAMNEMNEGGEGEDADAPPF